MVLYLAITFFSIAQLCIILGSTETSWCLINWTHSLLKTGWSKVWGHNNWKELLFLFLPICGINQTPVSMIELHCNQNQGYILAWGIELGYYINHKWQNPWVPPNWIKPTQVSSDSGTTLYHTSLLLDIILRSGAEIFNICRLNIMLSCLLYI